MKWTPRFSDITWLSNHLSRIKDGGSWGIPMNGSIWKVDHANRKLVCTVGPKDDIYERNAIVCGCIGWTAEYLPGKVETVLGADQAGSGKVAELDVRLAPEAGLERN